MLEEITTGTVFNMKFGFNDAGNLAWREDVLTSQKELFEYDNLNRLTDIDYYDNGTLVSGASIEIGYGNDGNIISKTDVGSDLNYGDGNAGPHALTEIEIPAVTFKPPPQDISYTSFNKVSSISDTIHQDTTINLSFTYGLSNQRVKTILKRNSAVEKIKYYYGDYEEDSLANGNVTKYHYINAPNGLTAVYVNTDTSGILYHILTDHLGSISGVINSETDAVTKYSYNAWGIPRQNDDWTESYTGSLFADRGYTGHEHLPEFNLINMNGRVYDPVLARFLSPDPIVQFPGLADGYNRYSYVMNNPLKYTDPSGYSSVFFSEYYRQKNIQNQYDGGYFYYRGEFYVWDKRSQTYTTYGNSFDTGPTGSVGAVNGYNWLTGEYQSGGETVPYYVFFAERGIGGNNSAIAAAGMDRKFAGSISWIQFGENYVKPIWEYVFWNDGEVVINPAVFKNRWDTEKGPLIPGIYETSWENLGYHVRNIDRMLEGNTYAEDDPSNAASQALLRTISEVLPPSAFVNNAHRIIHRTDPFDPANQLLDTSEINQAYFGLIIDIIPIPVEVNPYIQTFDLLGFPFGE